MHICSPLFKNVLNIIRTGKQKRGAYRYKIMNVTTGKQKGGFTGTKS